jgi:cytoskeletal protein CcmA (bactofilin family)
VKDPKFGATGRTTTVLTAETEFHGSLAFSGDLEIYGRLEGAIDSDAGLLTVGESAVIKATVKAQNIIVYGKIQGDVIALGRIELRGKAQVYGDVKTGRLLVEDGVTFVGRSESLHAGTEEKPDFNHIFTKLNPHPAPAAPEDKTVKPAPPATK